MFASAISELYIQIFRISRFLFLVFFWVTEIIILETFRMNFMGETYFVKLVRQSIATKYCYLFIIVIFKYYFALFLHFQVHKNGCALTNGIEKNPPPYERSRSE